jgi:GNAT superfamily N-acetyltransferase
MSKMELPVASEIPKLWGMPQETQECKIWRAGLTDGETAFALVEEYFEAIRVVAREDRRQFLEEYFGMRRGFWLAEAKSELAGCVGLRRLPLREKSGLDRSECAEIKRMYVRERFRGRGIAQRLLAAAERFARDEGYPWIYLDTTNEMVEAARLYERNGFERCERYNENPQAAIFMRKNLSSAASVRC